VAYCLPGKKLFEVLQGISCADPSRLALSFWNPFSPIRSKKAKVVARKTIKIGRPSYRVTKQRDPETGQRSLLFQVDFPEIEANIQPRHRFMSAYEQRKEVPDKDYQYVLFAAEPYETVAFQSPCWDIDKGEGKFFTHWDPSKCIFTLQLCFKTGGEHGSGGGRSAAAPPPLPPQNW
jgi:splicing factor 3A subunit 2